MGLALYNAEEIAKHHDEIRNKLKNQPAWCLRDGLVKEWLKDIPKDARITDLGSGIGEMERQLFALGFTNITSVDIDDYLDREMIGASPTFVKADLSVETLNLPDASQDVVLATQIFEHLENPWHCAREILRIVKPGGLIIVSIPHGMSFINRWKFLLSGDIEGYSRKNNHIAVFTNATFYKLWKDNAEVIRRDYAEGFIRIPLIGRKLRFNGRSFLGKAFTRKTAYVMKKK